jgi:hypothetical protein
MQQHSFSPTNSWLRLIVCDLGEVDHVSWSCSLWSDCLRGACALRATKIKHVPTFWAINTFPECCFILPNIVTNRDIAVIRFLTFSLSFLPKVRRRLMRSPSCLCVCLSTFNQLVDIYEIQWGGHGSEGDLDTIVFSAATATISKWRMFRLLKWM